MARKDRNWLEIDISCIKHNIALARQYAKCKIMGIVKANCYGLGNEVAVCCEDMLDAFGVASLDEGIALRKWGISKPILILGGSFLEYYDIFQALEYDITLSLDNIEQAKYYDRLASKTGKKLCVHIAVDTGMSRWGFVDIDMQLSQLKNLTITGAYSHFVMADSDEDFLTAGQLQKFDIATSILPPDICRHISNSSAILRYDKYFDMARLGIAMYGFKPSNYFEGIELKPCLKWYARVVSVRTISKGQGVSYAWTYRAQHDTNLATLAVGYADGYPRALSGKGKVRFRNRYFDIIGRICMDQTIIDTKDVILKVGDIVELLSDDGISADHIACLCDTINYEIISRIASRVPRFYVNQ